MTVVLYGGTYWLIDPQTGKVEKSDNLPGLLPLAESIIKTYPNCQNATDFVAASISNANGLKTIQALAGEPEPWYTNPVIRGEFEAACRRTGVDPIPFYPKWMTEGGTRLPPAFGFVFDNNSIFKDY